MSKKINIKISGRGPDTDAPNVDDLLSQVKDYFDLWILLSEDALTAAELRHAVEATFDRRKLALPSTLPSGLSDAFAKDVAKQRQWAAFLKKNRLEALDLAEVVAMLRGEFQKLAGLPDGPRLQNSLKK